MIDEMKNYRQWVVHRPDKEPLRAADGWPASNKNSADWCSYAEAVEACIKNPGLGLGFVLTEADPFACIDLDDATAPKHKYSAEKIASVQAVQLTVFNKFDSYSETSPSGKGCHIWVKGSVPSGKKRDCVEVYSSGRYMTVTQDVVRNIPIAECQELLTLLWSQMGGAPEPIKHEIVNKPQTQSDEEICRQASLGNNGNGELFQRLYAGSFEGQTQSEADLSLCNIVAFYTDNQQQVARIFRASALGQRKKAQRDDYLFHKDWGIVTKAFDRKGPMVDLSQMVVHAKPTTTISQPEIIEDDEDDELPKGWLRPPGLLGEIADFVYANAVNPVVEVSVAASIAYLAGICGRSYNYSESGLNQYLILLARTAGGKEGAASGMDKLTSAIVQVFPPFITCIGPASIASPQALVKQLIETPCMISHKDEIGMWLQKLTGKYAKTNEIELRGLLLALFGKSGQNKTYRGTIYSDRQKNVPVIDSPAFTLFGDSTPQEFYKALDEENIGEGLVARFTIIDAKDKRPTFKDSINIQPPPQLVIDLASLSKKCREIEMLKAAIQVDHTPDAQAAMYHYRDYCIDNAWKDRDNPILQIWTRAYERMIRLAALAAVGINTSKPIITIEHVQWACSVIENGMKVVLKRFEQGKVGEISYSLEQTDLVKSVIRKYINSPFNPKYDTSYRVTREMHSQKIMPYSYIQQLTRAYACFRKEKNPAFVLSNLLKDMVVAGDLKEFDMEKAINSTRAGKGYIVLHVSR